MEHLVRVYTFFLPYVLLFSLVQAEQTIIHGHSRARAFIELQCQTTLYPDLCIRTLSCYAGNFTTTLSHKKLAQIALNLTLSRAKQTRAYVTGIFNGLNRTKSKDYLSLRGCLDQINDGVDQIANCINETRIINEDGGDNDFPWHASNVETWMSTALTDSRMCLDRFSGRAIGGKTKAFIKAKVLNLQQITSNALALFNRFAARYRSSSGVKNPESP